MRRISLTGEVTGYKGAKKKDRHSDFWGHHIKSCAQTNMLRECRNINVNISGKHNEKKSIEEKICNEEKTFQSLPIFSEFQDSKARIKLNTVGKKVPLH